MIEIVFDHLPVPELWPNKARTLHYHQLSDVAGSAKAEAYFLIRDAIAEQVYIGPFNHLFITVTPKNKRRHDWDGCLAAMKPWIDSCKEAGIIEDDDWFHLSITLKLDLWNLGRPKVSFQFVNRD